MKIGPKEHQNQSRVSILGTDPFTESLAIFTMVLLSTFDSHGYQYAAEGVIEVQEYKPDGTMFHKDAKAFTVWVKDSQWQIKTVFGTNWYTLHGCDRTNIYSILYDPAPMVKPGQKINNPGVITKGTMPVDTAWHTSIPWFALASGQFLRNTNLTLPTLWNLPRVDLQSHIFAVDVERFVDVGGLPRAAEWKVARERVKSAARNEFLRRETLPVSMKNNMLQEQYLARNL